MKKYIQEHKYVLLVLYLPIYLIWFALVERMVQQRRGLALRAGRGMIVGVSRSSMSTPKGGKFTPQGAWR